MALNLLVLAAGLGTRLRPLSLALPKPLVPIADQNGLSLQLESLGQLEIKHRFANSHYKSEQIQKWALEQGTFDKVFVEDEILGTGGPLWAVYDAGYQDELLVVNGDVYHNMDLQSFVDQARSSGADVALLAHQSAQHNTLVLSGDSLVGIVGRFGAQEGERTTFTGISWYSPRALAKLRKEDADIRLFWQSQMELGLAPKVFEQSTEHFWIDVGSPQGYMDAVKQRLAVLGKKLYAEHTLPPQVGVALASVHGRVQFAGTAFLDEVVLVGGTGDEVLQIPDGAVLKNCVLGVNFRWNL